MKQSNTSVIWRCGLVANDEEFPEIYQVLGKAEEFETDFDIPEDWQALDDEAHQALLNQLGLTDADFSDDEAELKNVPVVAIVGRPNVGKSTLVNRIIGRREAVVEDRPGVTRDRVRYDAEWNGIPFAVIDTGGWERDPQGLSVQVSAQAERALTESDVIVFVVDTTVGVTKEDEFIIKVLRTAKVPIILVANKVDDERGELEAAQLWSLGLGEPFTVSALHGRGSGDLLDVIVAKFPEVGSGQARYSGPKRIALLGKPNVGKSSLLNALSGQSRAVVDSVAGTTVDPVDELIEIGGKEWIFVDTAGIRKRVKQASGHEYFATLRTQAALERCDVAVILLDASEPLTDQDFRILTMVVESGRALVIAFNKWDLLDDERRYYLEREIDRDLGQVAWAPRINVSAKTGWHTDRMVPALEKALEGWQTRISTGQLNSMLAEIVAGHPHPVRGGKQPKILFGTQASTAPPVFVLFTSGFLEPGYRRFVERRLR
ncbi:MAG: ribosome biogenesis GTPase Der, partial [Actinomycetales bacterium]|nr:ribosome biogenesis GTPase Der [Actinomycetales bacterium]